MRPNSMYDQLRGYYTLCSSSHALRGVGRKTQGADHRYNLPRNCLATLLECSERTVQRYYAQTLSDSWTHEPHDFLDPNAHIRSIPFDYRFKAWLEARRGCVVKVWDWLVMLAVNILSFSKCISLLFTKNEVANCIPCWITMFTVFYIIIETALWKDMFSTFSSVISYLPLAFVKPTQPWTINFPQRQTSYSGVTMRLFISAIRTAVLTLGTLLGVDALGINCRGSSNCIFAVATLEQGTNRHVDSHRRRSWEWLLQGRW